MKKYSIALLVIGLAAILAGVSLFYWMLWSPAVAAGSHDFNLTIRKGMSFNSILAEVSNQDLLIGETKVKASAFILGVRDQMKAGRYRIAPKTSAIDLLRMLSAGKVAIEKVTIPEGKHARQIASILQRTIEVDSSQFIQLVNDSAFIRTLELDVPSLEGFLFPNTYGFYWGMTPKSVVSALVSEFKKRFDSSLHAKAAELGLSLTEVITLASIIEGEAVVAEEREVISAVYWNRLRKNMRLQADPTIQYIIPDGPRRLLNRDLALDSPYNTYKYTGLPPGPVNNPGLASIRAALFPAKVDYLYFVANGDGTHSFSRSLREHLRAKARFDKIRKKVAKERVEG